MHNMRVYVFVFFILATYAMGLRADDSPKYPRDGSFGWWIFDKIQFPPEKRTLLVEKEINSAQRSETDELT